MFQRGGRSVSESVSRKRLVFGIGFVNINVSLNVLRFEPYLHTPLRRRAFFGASSVKRVPLYLQGFFLFSMYQRMFFD